MGDVGDRAGGPFHFVINGECVGSLVVLNRVSSGSIRGFGILMWCQSTRRRGSEQHDPKPGSIGGTEKSRSDRHGALVVMKPVVAGWTPSTGHPAPGLKGSFRPRPPGLDIPGRTVLVPEWTGPLKGYLKGLLRLG